jgi:predicted ATPase
MSERFVVLSGCSGGGKSTLLAELHARGYHVVEEPGRRIVKHELEIGGNALPWTDGAGFARRAIEVALSDREAAQQQPGWVFFDRGLIDAASALEHLTGESVLRLLSFQHRYHPKVFLAPPWPEIYVTDAERRHGFEAGLAEYERLEQVYPALGYEVIRLPKTTVTERADFVLSALSDFGVREQIL